MYLSAESDEGVAHITSELPVGLRVNIQHQQPITLLCIRVGVGTSTDAVGDESLLTGGMNT